MRGQTPFPVAQRLVHFFKGPVASPNHAVNDASFHARPAVRRTGAPLRPVPRGRATHRRVLRATRRLRGRLLVRVAIALFKRVSIFVHAQRDTRSTPVPVTNSLASAPIGHDPLQSFAGPFHAGFDRRRLGSGVAGFVESGLGVAMDVSRPETGATGDVASRPSADFPLAATPS